MGGGGFYTDGGSNANSAFVNGGGAGFGGAGGFGGGGGGYGGGGGGGWYWYGAWLCGGGGGGSYNRLDYVDNLYAVGTSNGWVKIESLAIDTSVANVYPVAKFKPVLNLQPFGAGIKVKWNKVV